jgi:hypothetical protein
MTNTQIRLYITATFLLFTTFVFGQTDTSKRTNSKWSVGTILFSEPNSYFNRTFSPNFFNGIIVKRHLNYFTIRLGIEYVKENIDNSDESEYIMDFALIKGHTNEGMIRMGLEKGFTFKKHYIPYFALDLTGIKSYSDITFNGGESVRNNRIITHTTGFGITPALGFEFKIKKVLSIAFETRLRLIYTKTIDDIDNLFDFKGSQRHSNKQFLMTFNRIGSLTLNFNF